MNLKKILCACLMGVTVISCAAGSAGAIQMNEEVPNERIVYTEIARASGSFNMSIPAKSTLIADTSFPLDAGETVRINASYTPDGSVDFGLVDSDGVFHYFNVTGGSIDRTIRVSTSGYYTLQIRNNSNKSIRVSGFVRY